MSHIFCFEHRNLLLLYNSLDGEGCVLSSSASKYFTIDEEGAVVGFSSEIPTDLKEYLQEKGLLMLTKDEAKYLLYLKKRLNAASKGELIGSIRLTITKDCNCYCEYCYVQKQYGQSVCLDSEQCFSFISRVIKKSKLKKYAIRFFGGEPTLFFGVITELVNKISVSFPDIDFEYTLNTNLQVINDEIMKFLSKFSFKVVVSLDGKKEQNDLLRHSLVSDSYYSQTKSNLIRLINNKINCVVAAVVTNSNRNNLDSFLLDMKKIGIKNVGLNCVRMCDSSVLYFDNDLATKLYDAYLWGEKNGVSVSGYWFLPFERILSGSDYGYCGGLGYELDLRPDGYIYSCVGNNQPLGSLENFDSIFKSNEYLSVVKRISPFIKECDGCFIQGLCAGECACNAKFVTNSMYSIDSRVCLFQKLITKKLINHYLDSLQ